MDSRPAFPFKARKTDTVLRQWAAYEKDRETGKMMHIIVAARYHPCNEFWSRGCDLSVLKPHDTCPRCKSIGLITPLKIKEQGFDRPRDELIKLIGLPAVQKREQLRAYHQWHVENPAAAMVHAVTGFLQNLSLCLAEEHPRGYTKDRAGDVRDLACYFVHEYAAWLLYLREHWYAEGVECFIEKEEVA